MSWEMFFDGWPALGRVVIVGALAYVGLVAFLRISGKRTLAKLNAFDLVVTVALGSTLSTLVTSSSVSLARGLTAFALLIGLQYVVAWSSIRSRAVARFARSEPTLLMRDGEVLHGALRRERVTQSELSTVIRQSPQSKPENVSAVILESDGSFSVIGRDPDDPVPFATAGLRDDIARTNAQQR